EVHVPLGIVKWFPDVGNLKGNPKFVGIGDNIAVENKRKNGHKHRTKKIRKQHPPEAYAAGQNSDDFRTSSHVGRYENRGNENCNGSDETGEKRKYSEIVLHY